MRLGLEPRRAFGKGDRDMSPTIIRLVDKIMYVVVNRAKMFRLIVRL